MKPRDKELAVQAGWIKEAGEPDAGCLNIQMLINLIRADEREACASKAEEKWYEGVVAVGKAIRARSNT